MNIVRTALEALAAVLGGTQSLHTNSFDEALALPTEEAARLALRTQQVIAHESGAVNTIDPLGGSYYVEHPTSTLEAQAYEYFDRIDKLGGVIPAIKENFFQREIAEASFRYQSEVEPGEARRRRREPLPAGGRGADPDPQDRPRARAEADRPARRREGERDSAAVEARLGALKDAAAKDGVNLMPLIVDAARDDVTLGEMCDALREVGRVARDARVLGGATADEDDRPRERLPHAHCPAVLGDQPLELARRPVADVARGVPEAAEVLEGEQVRDAPEGLSRDAREPERRETRASSAKRPRGRCRCSSTSSAQTRSNEPSSNGRS